MTQSQAVPPEAGDLARPPPCGRDRHRRHDACGGGRARTATPSRCAASAPSPRDLHRLADWFERCGVETVAMESHRRLLDPGLRGAGAARLRGGAGQRPRRQARAGPQDRRQRRPVAAAAARVWAAARQLPARRPRSPRCAPTCASASACWTTPRRTSSTCRRR